MDVEEEDYPWMSTAVNLEIGFEREEDNIWGEDGFKRRENRVKWSLTVELFPLYNIENHSSAEFINNSHLSAKESELWLSQMSFLKTKLFKTKTKKRLAAVSLTLLQTKIPQLCRSSSFKINCWIFFSKESGVWLPAMSLVKSWKLRKLCLQSQTPREKQIQLFS